MLCHQRALGCWMANLPLRLSPHKAAGPGTRSAEPSPAPGSWAWGASSSQPQIRRSQGAKGAGHSAEAPPGGFEGALGAGNGAAIGSRCAHCQQRCWELWVGTPLTPGRGTKSFSDNKSKRVGCTGAVTARSSLPTAAKNPEQSPALPPPLAPTAPVWHHTAFGASHGASTPSGNSDEPRGHKTGPNTPGGRDPRSPRGHSTRTSGMEDGQH